VKASLNIGGLHHAPHLRGRASYNLFRPRLLSIARFTAHDFIDRLHPSLSADFNHEVMTLAFQHFGHSEIEPESRFRPRVHRNTEARAARLPTVHRHDETVFTPRQVNGVGVLIAQQDSVLNGNGV